MDLGRKLTRSRCLQRHVQNKTAAARATARSQVVRQPSIDRSSADDLPFLPLSSSYCTRWPSARLESPARSTAEMWTNASFEPSSGSMKPKPFAAFEPLHGSLVIDLSNQHVTSTEHTARRFSAYRNLWITVSGRRCEATLVERSNGNHEIVNETLMVKFKEIFSRAGFAASQRPPALPAQRVARSRCGPLSGARGPHSPGHLSPARPFSSRRDTSQSDRLA